MSTVYRQSTEPRTDWFRVLADLRHRGVGSRTVARKLGVSKGTVRNWSAGSEPRHSDGERLLAMWCESTGLVREDVPTISPFDWRR